MRDIFVLLAEIDFKLIRRDSPLGADLLESIPPPGSLAPAAQPTPAATSPSFVDAMLFGCIAFIFLCTAVDWGLSKDAKRRMKERVGDYWTTLQYKSITAIFLQTLRTSVVFMRQALPVTLKSWKTYAFTMPVTLLLVYLFWWTVVSISLYALGYHTGTPWNPAIKVWPSVNVPLGIVLALWLYAFSAITWKGFYFSTIDYPSTWKTWFRPAVALLTCIALIIPAAAVYATLFSVDDIRNHISAIPSAIQMARGEPVNMPFPVPETANSLGDVVQAFAGAFYVIFRQYIMLAFLIFCLGCIVAATIGPYLALLTVWGVLFCASLALKWLHPAIAIILERIYQSDRGVLTQIGVGVAAIVKLIDEAMKRL